MQTDTTKSPPHTKGLVIRWARLYDIVVQIISLGREKLLRDQTVALANLQPGERVLDVGCGTGTLAIAVARFEPTAQVLGIDPAPTMIQRAIDKATSVGVDVDFNVGIVEEIDLEDASIDVVLSSLMLHHLPAPVLESGLREIVRVLKPGGRFVAVDFFGRAPLLHRLASRLRHNHTHPKEPETKLVTQLRGIGFADIQSGQMKPSYLSSLVAHKPQS